MKSILFILTFLFFTFIFSCESKELSFSEIGTLKNDASLHLLQGCFEATTRNIETASLAWGNCAEESWQGKIRWEAQHDPLLDSIESYKIFTTDLVTGVEYEDISMGLYYACYGIDSIGSNLPLGDLSIKNESGVLSYVGSSQWGEVYSFYKVIPNGSQLTLGFSNDYGETGEVIMIRDDGKTWPDHLTCLIC